MIDLLKRISDSGIGIDLNEGELHLSSNDTFIDDELLTEIRVHKDELISYLAKHNSLAFNKIEYQGIPKCREEASYPLSNAQLRLWLTNRIGDGAIAFNIPKSVTLSGVHEVTSFQKAIYAAIEKHEILRTVFKTNRTGEARQYILSSEELGFSIDYQDYRAASNPELAAQAYIASDSYLPFDLEIGPLLRASLLQLADDQYVFYYNMHHIISDEWSKEILSRDVLNYYEAYRSGTDPNIIPLRIQYKDYAVWQLEQLTSQAYQVHKRYWLERLSGELPVIDFPSDKVRPKVRTSNGKSLLTYFSEELTSQINRFVKLQDGSLFMLVLSAVNVLIYKYTSSRDIILGIPNTERNHPDLEDQIGFYVNVLASRNVVNPEENFTDFHNRVKEGVLEDFSHKQYPFDKLVEDLDLKYDPSRSAVYGISLTIHNHTPVVLENVDENIQDQGNVICKNDIEFHVASFENTLSLQILFNTDVYEEGMISTIMQHFKQLVFSLLSSVNEPIGNVEYLNQEERTTLLHAFNATQVAYPTDITVVDMFADQVRKTPDAIAVQFEEEQLTYGQLDERSNQLARYLQNVGVTRETLVPICVEPSLEMIIGIFGIIKAGGAYVPIDPGYPKGRINKILTEIDPLVILNSSKTREAIQDYEYSKIVSFEFSDFQVVSLDEDWESISREPAAPGLNAAAPGQLMYIIYTSGSTGQPKGVMIEHRSVVNHILHHSKEFSINESDRILLFSNFTFDASIEQMFLALTNGSALVLSRREHLLDAAQFKKVLTEKKVTHLHATPSYLSQLPFDKYPALRRVIAGGESCPPSLAGLWGSQYAFYNEYGPTETTITSIESKYDAELPASYGLPIGRPISNTQVYLLDPDLKLVPVGVVGELCIAGAGLARGYYNAPGVTAEKFIDCPFGKGEKVYKTGDYAKWLPSGELIFTGRKDNQVKIRGYRIELSEIEWALGQVEAIAQSVVMVREDKNGSKTLVVYFVGTAEAEPAAIQRILKSQLPEYMVPQVYVQLPEIPLNQNGKIDRNALPTWHNGENDAQEHVAPTTDTEVKLIEIWQEVLAMENIGILHNFFDLGGNSLVAVKMIAMIRKELDIEITIKNLFDSRNIAELASAIDFSLMQEELRSKAQAVNQIG